MWWPPGGQGTVLPLHTRRTCGRASAGSPETVASRAAARARREVFMAAGWHGASPDVNGAGRDNRLFFQLLTCCRETAPHDTCRPGGARRPGSRTPAGRGDAPTKIWLTAARAACYLGRMPP